MSSVKQSNTRNIQGFIFRGQSYCNIHELSITGWAHVTAVMRSRLGTDIAMRCYEIIYITNMYNGSYLIMYLYGAITIYGWLISVWKNIVCDIFSYIRIQCRFVIKLGHIFTIHFRVELIHLIPLTKCTNFAFYENWGRLSSCDLCMSL